MPRGAPIAAALPRGRAGAAARGAEPGPGAGGCALRGIGAGRRDATSGGGSPASLGSLPRRPARRAGGAVPAHAPTERPRRAQPGPAAGAAPPRFPAPLRPARRRRSRQHRGGTARGCSRAKNKSPLRGHGSGALKAARPG